MKGERAVACSFPVADASLVELMPGVKIEGSYVLSGYDGAMPVECLWFPKMKLTACYLLHSARIDNFLGHAKASVSRTQAGFDLFPFALADVREILAYLLSTRRRRDYNVQARFPNLRKVLTGVTQLPYAQASQTHLRHVTLTEFSQVFPDVNDTIRRLGTVAILLENAIGGGWATETFFLGMTLWALALPDSLREHVTWSGWWLQKLGSIDDFHSMVKARISARAKALQNILPVDLTPLFEIEVLVNRGVGGVDWAQEKANRTQPRLANFPPGRIREEAVKILRDCKALGARVRDESWSQMWERRWMWAPTGAFFSQYAEDNKYTEDLSFQERSKFSVLSRMGSYELNHFISRKAEIAAKASKKYEWGKMRAIYGTDITSFAITQYAMGECEEVLSRLFPLAAAAEVGQVKRRVKEVLKNGTPYCFDFEDFNSQHSTAAMREVLRAYREVFLGDASEEKQAAMDWVIRSVDYQEIQVPETGDKYVASDTLLSGWRLTTFMNTMLNSIYVTLAAGEGLNASIHTGDDVLATVSTLSQVASLQRGALEHDVRFQRAKCFLGGLAEFVRVDHNRGDGAQYLARSIASAVHGPMDMAAPYDPLAQCQAMYTRFTEVIERGGQEEVFLPLFDASVRHISERLKLDIDPVALRQTHVINGGFSTENDEKAVKYRFERKKVEDEEEKTVDSTNVKQSTTHRQLGAREFPGCAAYAHWICRKYEIGEYYPRILGRTIDAVLASCGVKKFTVRSHQTTSVTSTDRLRMMQFKKFKGQSLGSKANLARAFSIPIAVTDSLKGKHLRMLATSVDQLEALRLWF